MKYILDENGKDLIFQIDSKLNLVEVKGDSVMFLSGVRVMIKQLFDSLQEQPEEETKSEGG